MAHSAEQSIPESFSQRWSLTSRVAMLMVKGPRSIMLPHDPRGHRYWLSPVLRMIARPLPIGTVESKALYCMPVCLGRDPRSLLLLRRSRWDEKTDRETCKADIPLSPAVAVSFSVSSPLHRESLDTCVRTLDRACPSFHYVVEGLVELSTTPVQMDADVKVDTRGILCLGLWRATRSYSLELDWLETHDDSSEFSQAWHRLWTCLDETEESKPDASVPDGIVEKYDIAPEEYVRLFRHD